MRNKLNKNKNIKNKIKFILLCIISITILISCSEKIDQLKITVKKASPSYVSRMNSIIQDIKSTITSQEFLDVNAVYAKTPKRPKTKVTKKKITPKQTRMNPITPEQMAEMSLDEAVEKILDSIINKNMTDIEKIKAVHDYIVLNTEYDIENVNKGTIKEDSLKAKGVIYDRKAVCEGYANAFQLFMKSLNINSKIVEGYDLNSGISHAWNMVCLDGEWYQIDTTWDDPVPDQKGKAQYRYFLMPDKIFLKDHSWKKENYPSCTSEKNLYYIYKDNIISSITLYEKAFMERYNAGERTITILYPENEKPDMHFLLKYKNTRKEKDGGYTTSYNSADPWRLGDYTVFTVIME